MGKVRHLTTGQLLVQEKFRNGAYRLFKHPGTDNPGDACTKHVHNDVLSKHLPTVKNQFEDWGALFAPSIIEKR